MDTQHSKMMRVGVISSTSCSCLPLSVLPLWTLRAGVLLWAVAHLSESLHMIQPHIPGLIGLIRDRYCCFSFIGLFAAIATRERRVTLSCSTIYVTRDMLMMRLTLLVSFTVCCARRSNYQATSCHTNPPPHCLNRPSLLLGWCLVNDQITCLWMFLAPVQKLIFLIFAEQNKLFNGQFLLITGRKTGWTGT